MDKRPATIISDIDGTIFRHCGDITRQHLIKPELLPGVKEKFIEWDRSGNRIILISGRRESTRLYTEKQLSENGIFYDQLILGVTGGMRVLINDRKEGSLEDTCKAVNLIRNKGMQNADI